MVCHAHNNLPNALVIGPMKAGTTWIHNYLAGLGGICLPKGVKETFYFDRHYLKGPTWYAKHFSHCKSGGRIIEVAPSLFNCPDVPERVRDTLGDLTLIVTLRDPVKRAWSHYLHLRRYGYTQAPLRDAVVTFPQVLNASRYSMCLGQWQNHFSPDNIHVLWQEQMLGDLDGYARSLCAYLELDFKGIPKQVFGRSNEAAVAPSSSLAAFGRKVSYALRDHRMYGVVNLAKWIGLKQYFFGRPGNAPLPTLLLDDAKWLADQLRDDYQALPVSIRNPGVIL